VTELGHRSQFQSHSECKRGEKRAPEQLADHIKAAIVPVLEIVELTDGKQLRDHLSTSFRDLDQALPPGVEFFLDPREVSNVRPDAAASVFGVASKADLSFVPVD
jgi:hypothetical protein